MLIARTYPRLKFSRHTAINGLLLLLLLLLPIREVKSEIDWLYKANSCEELSEGISQHFGRGSNMDSVKKAELRLVLFNR